MQKLGLTKDFEAVIEQRYVGRDSWAHIHAIGIKKEN